MKRVFDENKDSTVLAGRWAESRGGMRVTIHWALHFVRADKEVEGARVPGVLSCIRARAFFSGTKTKTVQFWPVGGQKVGGDAGHYTLGFALRARR